MPIVNYTAREITCKIVYCGPGGSGKTSNLLHVYRELPEDRKGKMMSLATEADRELFFDFLPIDLGKIADFSTRLQLYTVPGQLFYEATRRLVLEGADGVVFVADSQARQLEDNIESLQDLHANLATHGVDPRKLPIVMQYNKRDLPASEIMPVDDLDDILNFRGVPSFPADAIKGTGVFESLRAISQLVFQRLDSSNGAK